MSEYLLLVLRLLVLAAFFVAFRRLELRGRGVVVVLVVLGVAMADAVLYPTTELSKPRSIFHPELFGQSFRLTQLVVPLGLAARLSTRGLPRRLDASAPLWIAFCAWMLVATAVGLASGNELALVLRQAALIVHVGGGIALAAGVPARDYVTGSAVPRFLQISAVVAGALFLADTLLVTATIQGIPDLPLTRLGQYGSDAATLFSSVGILGLVLGVSQGRGLRYRTGVLLPSLVLIVSHLASPQRAARLGLYVVLLILLLVFCTPTARRRVRVTGRQFAAGSAAVLVALVAFVFVGSVAAALRPPQQTSFATDEAWGGISPRTRSGSIESRYNQWESAQRAILQRPIYGHGLGVEVSHYEVAKRGDVKSDIAHNIAIDLLLRTGLVGALLAAAATLVVAWRAVSTWRWHPDDRVAALAMAALAITSGLIVKGMVESIFEKHRLALLLGIALGMAVSATMARHSKLGRQAPSEPLELEPARA